MTPEQYERLQDYLWLGGLLIGCIFLEYLIAPAADASIILSQGDPVYLNETVDLSLAASWPDYQIAWCSASNYDCDPPDQIIDLTGDMSEYLIDSKFRTGTYYRWDGGWHSAENSVAFTVMPGKRPKNTTALNRTATPAIIVNHEGPFNYLIARGDSPMVWSRVNRSDACHLWIFGNTMAGYNLMMNHDNDIYSQTFSAGDTLSMEPGTYNGYLQFDGNNSVQDVFLDDVYLDTPYDDTKIPDVPIMTWNLGNVKRQFDELTRNVSRFDDVLIPITVSVVDPTITVTSVEQDETKLYIMGETTWANDTPISLRLDPDNYALAQDIRLHTWQTFTTGSIDTPRTFATALQLDRDELYIGMHEITLQAEKNGDTAISSYNFRISDVMVMPTPTPEPKRMIYGKDYEAIPVKVTPTPTPMVNETDVPEEEIIVVTMVPVVNTTPNVTATATVNQTNPTAKQTIPTIPVSPAAVLAAVGVAISIRRLL